jgi:hypothetical protein
MAARMTLFVAILLVLAAVMPLVALAGQGNPGGY